MDQVKRRLTSCRLAAGIFLPSVPLTALLLLGMAVGQASAQSNWFSRTVSAATGAQAAEAEVFVAKEVDSARRRCGISLLAATSSSQICQSFKDHGTRMQCVADDLGTADRVSRSAVLGAVSRCYERLGEALIAGRGANTDQVNALEDVCRNVRTVPPVPRNAVIQDPFIAASNVLMPGFSRNQVPLPPLDPLISVRLQGLPECAVVYATPSGPAPSFAEASVPAGSFGEGAKVSTASVASANIQTVSVSTSISVPSTPIAAPAVPSVAQAGGTNGADARAEGSNKNALQADTKVGAQAPLSAMATAQPISESAAISALPAVSGVLPKPIKTAAPKAPARSAKKPAPPQSIAGYGEPAKAGNSGSTQPEAEPKFAPRQQNGNAAASGFSAASPPGLPLMGPPTRPLASSPVR